MATKNICTVLLITYNHAEYVKKAIESVLCQKTQYPFVIKIFDDASTDGSSDIIREYAKKYPNKIKAYIAKKNHGAQANIWNAYKSVDTKYCCLLETDDYWCDDTKLEQQINALEQHPECSFCAHQSIVHNINDKYRSDEDGIQIISNKCVLTLDKISLSNIEKQPCGSGYVPFPSSRLIRMSCIDLDKIKYKEAFLFDNCQFYYLLLKGDMFFINKVMTVYNQTGDGSCSGTTPIKRMRQHVNALMDFNKETNYVIEQRILEEMHFYTWYSFWLLNKTTNRPDIMLHGYICGLPLFKVLDNNNNTKIKKLFGLITINHTPDKFKLAILGIPLLQLERRVKGAVHNGLLRRLFHKTKNLIIKFVKKRLFLAEKHRLPSNIKLLIIDNYEPSKLLGGFRIAEFNWLLQEFQQSYLLTFSDAILKYSDWKTRYTTGDINWNFPMDIVHYNKNRTKYTKHFNLPNNQLLYMLDNVKYNASGAYIMFLYNTYLSYKFLEKNGIPFVFTLFPGGGLRLNHSFSDHMLKSVFASPMFRGVFVPQKIIYDYLIDKKLCPKEKIFFDYGGGFVQFTKNDVLPKLWYKQDKSTFDISFVAHKYMPKGLDKGFDLFLYTAREIIKKYPFVHFHCVGTCNLEDFNDDFADIQNNLHMYGTQKMDFFPSFFQKMDLNLSPNRPGVLDRGAFDGFPLSIEGMIFGTPLFCTDELKQNYNYKAGEELVIIKPDIKDICKKIEFYINNPAKLHKIGAAGQKKILHIFDQQYQKDKRKEFIHKYLDIK